MITPKQIYKDLKLFLTYNHKALMGFLVSLALAIFLVGIILRYFSLSSGALIFPAILIVGWMLEIRDSVRSIKSERERDLH